MIQLCLGSIGMDLVISKLCYKETILQKNFWKMTIAWSFSYNSIVKLYGKKKIGGSQHNPATCMFGVHGNGPCYT